MKEIPEVTLENQIFFIKGKLAFSNVMDLYLKSKDQIAKSNPLVFDFSEVKSSDSSGLALILEWIHFANENNTPITLKHLSGKLLLLAKVAGLESMILPLVDNASV